MNPTSFNWEIDNLKSIGGNEVHVFGAPKVIESPAGNAVEFNGEADQIVLNTNPLAGATEFTVEVVFYPYSNGLEEQRFLHFQEIDEKRVLIETRLTDNNQWFLDTFIKSGQSDRTLFAKNYLHPINAWYHVALIFKAGIMRHYVNGIEEMSGRVDFEPHKTGKTSIGSRLNQVSWYKGAIRNVRITHQALSPEEFQGI